MNMDESRNSDQSVPLDDRDDVGRFAAGNKASVGNRGRHLRQYLSKALTEADVDLALAALRRIIADTATPAMVVVKAAGELLDRAAGKATPDEMRERIEMIEQGIEAIRSAMGMDGQR
jgi:hypothetical protein